MTKTNRTTGFGTRAVKTYQDGDRRIRPLSIPVVQATNFETTSTTELGALYHEHADTMYVRHGNPTLTAVGQTLAALEETDAALVFPSGMNAITTALLSVLKSGDHVVAAREIFPQTYNFLDRLARSLGVETDFVDGTDASQIASALRDSTALIYVETPSNPLLQIIDIEAIGRLASARGIPLFVDGTFASPALQHPVTLGATLVLHSGSKYLNGHADVCCGIAAGGKAIIERVRATQVMLGGVLDPHAAWLLLRGLRTLDVRMERICANALALAAHLEAHELVRVVHYPFLDGSPYVALARRQMRGGGGVVSFELEGGVAAARAFTEALELVPIATSLGGVESVIEIPADLEFARAELGAAVETGGVNPGLLRLSVGMESIDDLKRDLDQGLRAVASSGKAAVTAR